MQHLDESVRNLLLHMLDTDHCTRYNAGDCLRHPWLSGDHFGKNFHQMHLERHMDRFAPEKPQRHPELTPEEHANLADDFQMFANLLNDTELECLKSFEKFCAMCAKHNMVLQPSKVKILFNEVDFYGWKLDANGRSPSERNVSPFRRMVPPTCMDDLRHVVGLFNCFRQFLVSHHEDAKTSVVRPHY